MKGSRFESSPDSDSSARRNWTRRPLTCCNLWRPSAWRQWRWTVVGERGREKTKTSGRHSSVIPWGRFEKNPCGGTNSHDRKEKLSGETELWMQRRDQVSKKIQSLRSSSKILEKTRHFSRSIVTFSLFIWTWSHVFKFQVSPTCLWAVSSFSSMSRRSVMNFSTLWWSRLRRPWKGSRWVKQNLKFDGELLGRWHSGQ